MKLSGKRKNPYQVRVNTRINEDGYPVYDVLACYPDRVNAEIALAAYKKCSALHNMPIWDIRAVDLRALWEHRNIPFMDTVLIYCYTGFRINELAGMTGDLTALFTAPAQTA